jgi:signal peptidase I
MKLKSFILEIIETILVSGVVILLVYYFIASIEVVSGSSMEPYFHSGERILVDRIAGRSKLKRGEIVVFYPPGSDTTHYVKRIVGIPGDVFKIIDCKVVISREGSQYILNEDYLSSEVCTKAGGFLKEGRSIRVPENKYVLLGDNREYSLDSRNLGFIDVDRIVGRVVFRLWPVNKISFIN